MNRNLKKLIYAALCLALCMVLPLLTGQIPEIGKRLSPMHIPVFLCGFLCGWPWGLAVGAIAPILRSFLFGMPALYPDAIVMSFELATKKAVERLRRADRGHARGAARMGFGKMGAAGLKRHAVHPADVPCRRVRERGPGHYPAHRPRPRYRPCFEQGGSL